MENKQTDYDKSDFELIQESYEQQLNEGIMDRLNAKISDSMIGRGVGAIGNILNGDFSKASSKFTQGGGSHKFNSLLQSHGPAIQKALDNFVNDLIKTNVVDPGVAKEAFGKAYNNFIKELQTNLNPNDRTLIGKGVDAVNAVGQGAVNAIKNLPQTGQKIGNTIGSAAGGIANIGNSIKQGYNNATQGSGNQTEENEEYCNDKKLKKLKRKSFFTKSYKS